MNGQVFHFDHALIMTGPGRTAKVLLGSCIHPSYQMWLMQYSSYDLEIYVLNGWMGLVYTYNPSHNPNSIPLPTPKSSSNPMHHRNHPTAHANPTIANPLPHTTSLTAALVPNAVAPTPSFPVALGVIQEEEEVRFQFKL